MFEGTHSNIAFLEILYELSYKTVSILIYLYGSVITFFIYSKKF